MIRVPVGAQSRIRSPPRSAPAHGGPAEFCSTTLPPSIRPPSDNRVLITLTGLAGSVRVKSIVTWSRPAVLVQARYAAPPTYLATKWSGTVAAECPPPPDAPPPHAPRTTAATAAATSARADRCRP